jgi:preprotein translocase subunit YajC
MSFLDTLDNTLEQQSEKDRLYLNLMIIMGLIFVSFYYIVPLFEQKHQNATSQLSKIERNLFADQNYIQQYSHAYFQRFDQEISKTKQAVALAQKTNEAIDYHLSQLDNLVYTDERYGAFLHDVYKNAAKSKVQIVQLENSRFPLNSNFSKVLTLNIKTLGGFHATLQFIDTLESNDLVIDVDNLTLTNNEKGINADIKLVVWGFKR